MSYYCQRLPDKLYYEDYFSLEHLIEEAYRVFLNDLFNYKVVFNAKPVHFFENPIRDGFEQGFYHCTTTKSDMKKGRTHDVNRLERIPWIKPILENVNCELSCCDGFMVWTEPLSNKTHIYMDSERYLIVLIEKENVYDFITAFYVEGTSQHKKLMNRYYKHG